MVGQRVAKAASTRTDPADKAPSTTPANAWQSRYDALLAQTNPAVDQLRSVVKWLAASLGAVAALLLAGVQLTSIGNVAFTQAAIGAGAVLVTLSAVAAAIFKLTNVLIPAITTRQDVIQAARTGEFGTFVTKHNFLLANEPSIEALDAAHKEAAKVAKRPDATPEQKREWQRLTEALDLLVPFGSYFAVRRAYRDAKKWTGAAAAIASVGVVTFAWLTGQTPASDGSAAVSPQPIAGVLQLNEEGVRQMDGLLQPGCADQLGEGKAAGTSRAANAISLKATDEAWKLILIPGGSCGEPEAIDVAITSGRFVGRTSR